MITPGSPNAALLGNSSQYRVVRSLRFRNAVSAYLSRVPATQTSITKWTLSTWVKLGLNGTLANQGIFSAGSDTSNFGHIQYLFAANCFTMGIVSGGTELFRVQTAAGFRDPSAHLHLVVAFDTTQAADSDRIKIYVTNVKQAITLPIGWPALNNGAFFNTANTHVIGNVLGYPTTRGFDGLLSDFNFIDGLALTPSSFGEYDLNGNWNPKKYAGAYGTNGSNPDFSDNSAATAATIGKDRSGNNNDWTPSAFSVTAGVTNDSLIDTPTNYDDGGNGRGNYCVVNPLKKPTTSTLSNSNLTVAWSATGGEQPATFSMSNGKWYWEQTQTGATAAAGIILETAIPSSNSLSQGYHYYGNGQFYTGTSGVAYGASFTSGDVIGIAIDLDANQITFYKNGVSQGAKTIAAGVYNPDFASGGSVTLNANFGQYPFSNSPPTGFKALNTQNLSAPSILIPSKYFDATPYAGTGVAKSVVNSGTFAPDLVWSKSRSAASSNILADSVRGPTTYLVSNTGAPEGVDATMYPAFNSDGFSVGTNNAINTSGGSFIAWQWKKGAIPGFDIVSYTGNDAARSVAHSLGAVPALKFVKQRTGTRDWFVNHKGIAATSYLILDGTDAPVSNATLFAGGDTSSVFTLGNNSAVNGGATGYISYLWAEVPGFSKFGTYNGIGLAYGLFVNCGFRPKAVWVKRVDTTGSWIGHDSARDPMNLAISALFPNLPNAESTGFYQVDLLSNGFIMRNSDAETNASGGTFIYMAFAENPFKYARAK